MLHSKTKKQAIHALKRTLDTYNKTSQQLCDETLRLYEERTKIVSIIERIEEYINQLANTPKEFSKDVEIISYNLKRFDALKDIGYDERKANKIAGGGVGAGLAAGASVAAFAPTAAMAIATTFGTASTGTAISALSGAAATNAALAWIGGGTLAAGGGGMAAGQGVLALAGPLGWAIGGTALAAGGWYTNKKNKEAAIEANKERFAIEKEIKKCEGLLLDVTSLLKQSRRVFQSLDQQFNTFIRHANGKTDYRHFTDEMKKELGSIINNTYALSKLLNVKIGD
ncbi:hypothetical protein AALF16_24095 [Bacillus cereus]|uniref:hypothetical protein n=1 Tax=Bacillus cereus TaxID=1396 RepID=UPI00356CE02F